MGPHRPAARRAPPVGALSKRGWRRLHRRALQAHQAQLTARLQAVAAAGPTVTHVHVVRQPVAMVRLLCATAVPLVLTLAGVEPVLADRIGAARRLRLVDAGRYGPLWWIDLRDLAAERSLTPAGSHLRIDHQPGGAGPPWPGADGPGGRPLLLAGVQRSRR